MKPKPAAVGAGTHPWDALGGGECIQPFTSVWAEEFTVVDAEDAKGAPVKRMMELKLDTLAVETGDGYWLDTGILSIQ